jgi:hypothetical protein
LVGIAIKQSGNQTIVTLTEISAGIDAIALLATIIVARVRRKKDH